MHDVLAGYVERGEMPGLVALVSQRGETHVEVIGKAAFDDPRPMRRDSIFRIASLSKPVAAAAAMLLIEEGKLQLNEPVDRLLPELANRKVLKRLDGPLDETVPATRPITTRDLLTFCWGFGVLMVPPGTYPIQKAAAAARIRMGPPLPQEQPSPDEWMRGLGTLPLMYQPGEKWMYDTGSDVLGVLIARAAGQPFDVFLRERLFEPLGMKDTAFSVPPEKLDRLTTSYYANHATGKLEVFDQAKGGQWSRTPAFPSGGGGLVSTVDDYLAFSDMLLNKGSYRARRILSKASVEAMLSDQLTAGQKTDSALLPGYFDDHGWGFGVAMTPQRNKNPGRYGWDGGLGTSWASDPRHEFTGILMTQRAWTSPNPPDVCVDFWAAAYQFLDD
jgi:CubicO group peptidase (beta-lactamase class C family)